MLHRFEKFGLVICDSENQGELVSGARHWSLTPTGVSQFQVDLALLVKIFRLSRSKNVPYSWEQLEEQVTVKPQIVFSY